MANETGRIGWSNNIITGLEENPLMENVFGKFNKAFLVGVIGEEFKLNHVVKDEKFYRTKIKVERFSGTEDIIPVIVPEKLIEQVVFEKTIGKWVAILGQLRSYNREDEKGSIHLDLFLFTKRIKISETKQEIKEYLKELSSGNNYVNNLTFIDGYICKKPNLRETPLEKQIADLFIAVNRSCRKSDYIPCIAWEKVALKSTKFDVGSHVKIYGRIQSRYYYKKFPQNPNVGEWKITYELSVIRIKPVK